VLGLECEFVHGLICRRLPSRQQGLSNRHHYEHEISNILLSTIVTAAALTRLRRQMTPSPDLLYRVTTSLILPFPFTPQNLSDSARLESFSLIINEQIYMSYKYESLNGGASCGTMPMTQLRQLQSRLPGKVNSLGDSTSARNVKAYQLIVTTAVYNYG
jgi:hypothetical protein